MAGRQDFGRKLDLALKALSMSRGRLAQEAGVDKSLVGRWVSGHFIPSEFNLEKITSVIAKRLDGFSMLDWDRAEDSFIERVGGTEIFAAAEGSALSSLLPFFAKRASQGTAQGLDRYGGLWVQFYAPMAPAPLRPLFCGGVMISDRDNQLWYAVSDGSRGVWTGAGPAFTVEGKMWVLIEEHRGRSDLCAICFHGTTGHAAILDGLALARAANAGGVPVSGRFTLVRLADLPADPEEAQNRFSAICAKAGDLSLNNLAGQLPDWITDLLLGEASNWGERHQAFVLAVQEADNLTTNSMDIDMFPAGRGTRRALVDTVQALFAP
jgi:transcriptional regulator with XRE-family HTH domain